MARGQQGMLQLSDARPPPPVMLVNHLVIHLTQFCRSLEWSARWLLVNTRGDFPHFNSFCVWNMPVESMLLKESPPSWFTRGTHGQVEMGRGGLLTSEHRPLDQSSLLRMAGQTWYTAVIVTHPARWPLLSREPSIHQSAFLGMTSFPLSFPILWVALGTYFCFTGEESKAEDFLSSLPCFCLPLWPTTLQTAARATPRGTKSDGGTPWLKCPPLPPGRSTAAPRWPCVPVWFHPWFFSSAPFVCVLGRLPLVASGQC